MNARDLLDAFRSEVDDQEEPVLWTDEEIYGYIDNAQIRFCQLTDGIGDASSAGVTQLPVVTAEDWVDISPLILKFRTAYRTSDGAPIQLVNAENLYGKGLRFDGRTGPLTTMIIGLEPARVRVYPVPVADDTIQLAVDRLPLLAIDKGQLALEIANQHHIHLLKWAKHRAYSKQDSETRDDKKAADNKADFEAYCFQAKLERERAAYKPSTVAYGGI